MAFPIIGIAGLVVGVGGVVYAVIQGRRGDRAINRLQKAVEGLLVGEQKVRYIAQNPGKAFTPEVWQEILAFAKNTASTIAAGETPLAETVVTSWFGKTSYDPPDLELGAQPPSRVEAIERERQIERSRNRGKYNPLNHRGKYNPLK